MFWEDAVAERELFNRIFRTEPFKIICGNSFNHTTTEDFAKPMTLRIVKEVLSPSFSDQLRDACLREIGKTCWHMVREHGNVDTEMDIDSFIKNMNLAHLGYRRLKRRGNLVFDEMYARKCPCPIINHVESGKDHPEWCDCSISARRELFQMVVKKPVQVELLESIIRNGSNVCRWVINLEPKKLKVVGNGRKRP